MRCPTCNGELRAWPWQDGGYKGVQCDACGGQWWSESFATSADEAARAAVADLAANSGFPADAVTDEETRRRWDEELKSD